MKKVVRFVSVACVLIGIAFSYYSFSQSETCTLQANGSGHCEPIIGPNGSAVGFHCVSGMGYPPCYF